MSKLPAFQFYPGDWMKDPSLRRCSQAARGVWVDMLCLMFECDERGVLITGGCAWPREDVAAAVGGNLDVSLRCVDELISKGVCAIRESDGALYSRRMVRDELKRADDKERKRAQREREDQERLLREQRQQAKSVTAKSRRRDKPDTNLSAACPEDVTTKSHSSSSSVSSSSSTSKQPPPPLDRTQTFGIGRTAKRPKAPQADRPGWVVEVEEELILLGIDDLSCLQAAIDAGLIEPAIRELVRHYREQQTAQGWTPKALHYRLRTAKTTLPSDRGWPQPAPEAAKQQQQTAQEQQRLQAEARRQQQKSAEQQRKQLAAQTYDSLDRQFGATLDALSDADALALAASVSPDLAKRLRSVGDRSVRSIRGQLLGRLAGQRAEQLESALGPQLDALPPQELQDLAARAGTHCLQQIKRHDPLQGQLRHQLLLALHDATTNLTTKG